MSKQCWSEITAAVIATELFVFDIHNFPYFRLLALSSKHLLMRIRRLHISLVVPSCKDDWYTVLTSSLVGRLKSLQSLYLYIGDWSEHQSSSVLHSSDVMNNKEWKTARIPMILRSFQQCRSRPSLTTIEVENFDDRHFRRRGCGADRIRTRENVTRRVILDRRPRRLSKRNREQE